MLATLPAYWSNYTGGPYKSEYEVDTGLSAAKVEEISNSLTTYPRQFHIHPKIKKLLEQRREMGRGERLFDYGMAEALAFGSLLLAGTPVRLSGQDSQRGTFNQRHSVLVDIENEQLYIPLANLAPDQARFEVYNSMLSEAGVLGFEYGYSRDYPEALVLWEAQFGDFANGAQIIIDQFIASGEDKWGLLGGVVMLLPHGYEGQGPEHSSARLERYLQLAAHDNIQICQPSTAAQYFHLLRRQAMRAWRKPLIVFTPKSMLRNPDASSPVASFELPRFQTVLPETEVQAGQASAAVHGQDRSRVAHRTGEAQGQHHRHRLRGTAVSLAGGGTGGGNRPSSRSARNSLGAGRAGQYGGALLCGAALAQALSGTQGAQHQAFSGSQSSNRLGQGARPRTKDAHQPRPARRKQMMHRDGSAVLVSLPIE